MEVNNLHKKDFRVMIVRMIQDLRKNLEAKMDKLQETLNKEIEDLKNKQAEMRNKITEVKNSLEANSSRIQEARE